MEDRDLQMLSTVVSAAVQAAGGELRINAERFKEIMVQGGQVAFDHDPATDEIVITHTA